MSYGSRIAYSVLRNGFILLLGYLFILTPWFIRNWQVAGTPLSAAGSQTMWLTDYDDLFSYGREASPRAFFAQGWPAVLAGRRWVLTTNLQTVLAVWGMIFLAPLAGVGMWRLRHHRLVQLAVLYGVLLFVIMTLVFAFPGARGGLFHSGAALLPFVYATAVVGLDESVEWVARRRRHWDVRTAKQVFGVGVLAMAVALSGFVYYNRVLKNNAWNQADPHYPALVEWVMQQNQAATVMIGNPPAYRYHGGGLSVVVPNESLAGTLEAVQQYRVDYLVLGPNHPAPLAAIYRQPENRPGLSLVRTFGAGTDNAVYVFEVGR
jgi:hypothetical protein